MRHAKRIFSTLSNIRPRLRSHDIPNILHNHIRDLILHPRIIHFLRRRSRTCPFRTRRTLPTRRRGPTRLPAPTPIPTPSRRRSRRLNGLKRQMLPRLAAAIPLRILALLAIMLGHDV